MKQTRNRTGIGRVVGSVVAAAVAAAPIAGCGTAGEHRREADRVVGAILDQKQREALGKTEPFTVERPADTLRRRLLVDQALPHGGPASLGVQALRPIDHWPKDDYLESAGAGVRAVSVESRAGAVRLGLVDALQVGAHNSSAYQSRKEAVYLAALDLDLERDAFRATFAGVLDADATADWSGDELVAGGVVTPGVGVSQRFYNGLLVTTRLALDLVQLLQPSREAATGIAWDTSVTMPLLRGAGRHIVTEALTQAERDVVYALLEFDQFKREFATEIASQYLDVLQQFDEVQNNEAAYRRLVSAAQRSSRLAVAGRLPEVQVDQAVQAELRARGQWIEAMQDYAAALDEFKVLLGLPPDAQVELDRDELERLGRAAQGVLKAVPVPTPTTQPAGPGAVPQVAPSTRPSAQPTTGPTSGPVGPMPTTRELEIEPPSMQGAGPYELPEADAARLALENRPDLRVARGAVADAQRGVVVAADALRAGLDVAASASFGERRGLGATDQADGRLRLGRGRYDAAATLELPLERTAERNAYRASLIELERAVRGLQDLEDEIKLDVRNDLRDLLRAREAVLTQAKAVAVAQRRVSSTDMLIQAGRAEIRDVLEAQDDLVEAQNEFTTALVEYRVAELELQRDAGVLEVDNEGLWREYRPGGGAP